MAFVFLDHRRKPVHIGTNWAYTRAYLDFLCQHSDKPFGLVVLP